MNAYEVKAGMVFLAGLTLGNEYGITLPFYYMTINEGVSDVISIAYDRNITNTSIISHCFLLHSWLPCMKC